ncbi:MAG TPA: DNA-directed DNA polymerase [Acidobacteriota bacterium]|nr:DNA-directed DNA polymerase [Acidobacteriota bacterium]
MHAYPIDFTIEQNDIVVFALEDGLKKKYTVAFKNYFYVLFSTPTSEFPVTDDRIESVVQVDRAYYGEPQTFWQVFVKKLYDCKDVSTSLMTRQDVSLVLEADIPPLRKWLIDTHVKPLCGYPVVDGKIDFFAVPASALKFSQLRVVGIDIETYATSKQIDSQRNPILMVALYVAEGADVQKHVLTWSGHTSAHTYVTQFADEKSMLLGLDALLKQIDPHIICGYNSDAFDWPYIVDRCAKNGVSLTFSPLSFTGGVQKNAMIVGSPHIDICTFIRINFRTQLKTNSYSLNAVSSELLSEQKKSVDIQTLYKAWDARDPRELDVFIEYNLHDSYLCVALLEKLFMNIFEFVSLIKLPLQDLSRMSYSQLVESFLLSKTRESNVLAPNKPTREEVEERLKKPPFEGAFVFKPTPGLYKNIVVCDFRSLYPSIIASLNIERSSMNKEGTKIPAHRVPEYDAELYFALEPKAFVPHVIEEIIVRRTQIKTESKSASAEEKLLLEARSYNLKILANSIYGYLSFAHARWYCEECGAATTAYARHYIKYTIRKAQEAGFTVLYSDTDSVFLQLGAKSVEDAKAWINSFNKTLPGIMMLQFEESYVSGIFVSAKGGQGGAKKRYALRAASGKFKITGFEYVRNDWCDFARETQKELIRLILEESNPVKALEYVRGRIKKLQSRDVTLDALEIRDRISRDLSEYESNLPHVVLARQLQKQGESIGRGSMISYIVTTGHGPIYERVKFMSQIKVSDYDIEYYVQNQLVPVVSSILEVFGYKKEDITSSTSQQGLSSFF